MKNLNSQSMIQSICLLSLTLSACGNQVAARVANPSAIRSQAQIEGATPTPTPMSTPTKEILNRRRVNTPDPKKIDLTPSMDITLDRSIGKTKGKNTRTPRPESQKQNRPGTEVSDKPSTLEILEPLIAPAQAATATATATATPTPTPTPTAETKAEHDKLTVPQGGPESGPVAGPVSSDEEEEFSDAQISEDSLNNLKQSSERAELVCKNTGNAECPQAVVMITIPVAAGLAWCTGFLISEDEVMTNNHCVVNSLSITKDLRKTLKNIPCSGFVHTHFIASNPRGTAYTVGCESIEMRSGGKKVASPDYAIIKLQSRVVDRTPLKLSTRGFKNEEQTTIYRVQQDKGADRINFTGEIEKINCKASYGTYGYPGINAINLPLMTFGDCPILSGNSGSPAFNEDGEVSAIIQGHLEIKPKNEEIGRELESTRLDSNFGVLAYGTQFLCTLGVPGYQASVCGPLPEFSAPYPKSYVELYGSPFQLPLPELAQEFTWRELKLSQNMKALHKVFVSVPSCTHQSVFQARVMRFKEGLNRSYLPEWRVNSDETVFFKEEFNEEFKEEKGDVPHYFTSEGLGRITIPACPVN